MWVLLALTVQRNRKKKKMNETLKKKNEMLIKQVLQVNVWTLTFARHRYFLTGLSSQDLEQKEEKEMCVIDLDYDSLCDITIIICFRSHYSRKVLWMLFKARINRQTNKLITIAPNILSQEIRTLAISMKKLEAEVWILNIAWLEQSSCIMLRLEFLIYSD